MDRRIPNLEKNTIGSNKGDLCVINFSNTVVFIRKEKVLSLFAIHTYNKKKK